MKGYIDITGEDPRIISFIHHWQKNKHYEISNTLSFFHVFELCMATTHTFRHEDSDGRFFNNSLQNEESSIQWDGAEPIDILFFQVCRNILFRLRIAKTINDTNIQ